MLTTKITLLSITLLAHGNVYADDTRSANANILCVATKKTSNLDVIVSNSDAKAELETGDKCDSSLEGNYLSATIYYDSNKVGDGKGIEKEDSADKHEFLKFILEWLLKLLSNIIWPICLIFVLLAFKRDFSLIIKRLKSVSVPGGGFELHDLAEKYEGVGDGVVDEKQETQANLDPRGSIISAWLNLEVALNELYYSRLPNNVGMSAELNGRNLKLAPVNLIRWLRDCSLIDAHDFEILNDLRIIRNDVVHKIDYEPTQADVVKYISLANEIENKLRVAIRD